MILYFNIDIQYFRIHSFIIYLMIITLISIYNNFRFNIQILSETFQF